MSLRSFVFLGAIGWVFAPAAGAAVFKCTADNGRVTYQQMPCPDSSDARVMDTPAEFPPVDTAERERIFQREADMYRRLEAQRDRLSAEAIARITRPEPEPVAMAEPFGVVAWPAFVGAKRWPQRAQPRNAMRDWANGRLR